MLFGLYVDGLEKRLLETADIDAPTLMGVMVPLLLYADDLILMSESAAGLQKQLDALQASVNSVNLQSTSTRQTLNLAGGVGWTPRCTRVCT